MKMFFIIALIFSSFVPSTAQKGSLWNQRIFFVDSVKISYNKEVRVFKITVTKAKHQQGY